MIDAALVQDERDPSPFPYLILDLPTPVQQVPQQLHHVTLEAIQRVPRLRLLLRQRSAKVAAVLGGTDTLIQGAKFT